MLRIPNGLVPRLGQLPAIIVSATFAIGVISAGQAQAATKEVILASTAQALTYCQSGKMPAGDIAYISGAGGLAQFGPTYKCVQQVPTAAVKKAVAAKGKRVSECKLVNAKAGILFCQDGGMGTYDIAYISGKVGHTVSGPGYGCVANYSTTGIGNALCK